MRNLLKWSLLLTFLTLLPLQAFAGEDTRVKDRISQYLTFWKQKNVTGMEFMLHNSFIASDGSNKQKFVARLQKEAAMTRSRNIDFTVDKVTVTGNSATVLYDMEYHDNFTNNTAFHSCVKATVSMTRFTDGNWYLLKEAFKAYNCLE